MLSFLYVYSDHSILECYNLFSGVELSMRSFFVIASTTGKHTHIIKENSKGMEDLSASNISHVSLKPSQCIHITTLCAGTFQNHDNTYGIFSDRTQLSSSLFNRV